MALCIQCTRRPRPKDNSRMTCRPCTWALEGQEKSEKEHQRQMRGAKPTNYRQYTWVLHWKGCLIGYRPQAVAPGEDLKWTAVRIDFGLDINKVPQGKLVNIDLWVPQYTREQVMNFKRVMRQLFPEVLVKQRRRQVKKLEPIG